MKDPKSTTRTPRGEPIAVIGSGCRFPGSSSSPSKLWELLENPRDVLRKIGEERFNPDAFYHPDGLHHGSSNVTSSYLLEEDHRHFDANFFNIKPIEAHAIDPQQRLLLESVYESLESAGLSIEALGGSQTAVYVGLMCGDYSDHIQRDVNTMPTYMATGTARSIMSNRISYFFDWHGPSMTIDTACSSSLVAVHQAVQTLRSGDSRVAIAAGSNLILGPELYIGESKLKMLSPGSRSRMWDIDADGYARGEGVAAIVLKTLSAALEDGDHVECIIRETGVNQDGKTKGITMPSQIAQANLIRSTYQKAGLDPESKADRCQYFEAHGTGTSAGDCREAEAISKAFFGQDSRSRDPDDVLFVGSIKTIVGHTEGTAGIAGLMKASLALQYGVIPPNMLLNQLSPAVEPFANNLKIATTVEPWPTVPNSICRRASVNSFGFGGTNAHVILESFHTEDFQDADLNDTHLHVPFTFSAASEPSLKANLAKYVDFLHKTPSLSLQDLAYTLQSRRSVLPIRAAFSAASVEGLVAKLRNVLENPEDPATPVGVRVSVSNQRLLGVFTGQGAQWARMGRELIIGFPIVRGWLEDMQQALYSLPAGEKPRWSLIDELSADSKDSRLGEAAFAQPLCTAVQVVLVNLLRAAGIRFDAVVGHSSGEIGAAYAAGFITSDDAIKIAYYRGFFSNLAGDGKPGAMMAVGTSFEDATDLCTLPKFSGRLHVAASNSPSSITVSGDKDAVEEAKLVFEEEKKFARLLKVDKAYHSHHMLSCSASYIRALQACDIKPNQERADESNCVWFSSVFENIQMEASIDLAATYWKDNMVKPVMFSQAIQSAWKQMGGFSIALEVGPHPALKGPALQSIQELSGNAVAYTGVLQRGSNDVEAFSNGLGFLWANSSKEMVDFRGFNRAILGQSTVKLMKGLPTYSWQHDRIYWHESRMSKAFRTQKDPPHPLLGARTVDGVDQEMRWRNLLRVSELPWIRGHQLQGQMVFPAAGYIATAIEAARKMSEDRLIRMIEIRDFVIGKPLTFDDDDASIETLFALSLLSHSNSADPNIACASFTYHALTHKDAPSLTLLASGSVQVIYGKTSTDLLPSRQTKPPNLVPVETDAFYSSLIDLGYEYTGPFRALESMQRKLSYGTGFVSNPDQDPQGPQLLLHPALLDASFQAIFLAFCWPNDGNLLELHIPTKIKAIRVNAPLCHQLLVEPTALPFDSHLNEVSGSANLINGDVDVFEPDGGCALLQIEGVSVVPFNESSADSDRQLFSQHVWQTALPDGELATGGNRATPEDYSLATVLERASIFYLRNLEQVIPKEERQHLEWHHETLFGFAAHIRGRIERDRQPFAQKEWINDTSEDITELLNQYPDSIEIRLTRTVGENLPAAVRGQTNILQHMFADNLLNRYYTEALGLVECTDFLAKTVAQLVHRFPHMNILEIGAGTGGATKGIMQDIGTSFSSYTFTDISTGFFEKAQDIFKEQGQRMVFKALDAEKDISDQGYEDASYDLVIASLVLHATASLETTLTNVRRLLKPGGYLIMLEVTTNDPIRVGFAMSGLPGWWLGRNDGREFSPCVSSLQWHELLCKTGFAGIDTITPEVDSLPRPFSVIASQAVDDRMSFLRQPLPELSSDLAGEKNDLVILGGHKLRTSRLVQRVSKLLRPWCSSITHFGSLEELNEEQISPTSIVLSLVDLDYPVFDALSEERLQGLKDLFAMPRTILWITEGCRADNPLANMSVGFGRTLVLEAPDVRLQFLDFDVLDDMSAQLVAEALVRLHVLGAWEKNGMADQLLWSTEPEIAFEEKKMMVPRVKLNHAQIARHNASRRTIVEQKDPRKSSITLQQSGSSWQFANEDACTVVLAKTDSTELDQKISMRIDYSSAAPCFNNFFLVLQTASATKESIVGLSTVNGSLVEVPTSMTLPAAVGLDQAAALLSLLVTELQVEILLSQIPPSSVVLLHEPDPNFAARLEERATARNSTLFFTTSHERHSEHPWIKLHPQGTSRAIREALPRDVAVFVDCNANSDRLSDVVAATLQSFCRRTKLQDILHEYSGESPLADLQSALDRAGDILERTDVPATVHMKTAENIDLSRDIDGSSPLIIDWASSLAVPTVRKSIDTSISFAANKTYVFFGLTSDLGQSLGEWMIRHGARYMVFTSRNPNISPEWLKLMAAAGATVKVLANDITDHAVVKAIVSEIREEFPPIAGVVNGAMVLRDAAFLEMPLATMESVLRPKVLGSTFLNELFQEDNLEFFVFFSSLAAVSGNRGQSNYSAANMFMASLAAQRRKRGLVGSVIHIGAILGVGYVTREVSNTVFDAIKRAGFTWMSERDFHHCFAEAVLAGQPSRGLNPEIITGLRMIHVKDHDKAPWMENPKFGHCVVHDTAGNKSKDIGTDGVVPTHLRLLEARSPEDINRILEDAFIRKLKNALQLSSDRVADRAGMLASGAEDLGIDSLVAVEVRSWFLKELKVDMPVLRMLGGASIKELIDFAAEKLPTDMIPNVGSEQPPAAPADEVLEPKSEESAAVTESNSSTDYADTSDEADSIGMRKETVATPLTSAQPSTESSIVSLREAMVVEKRLPMSLGQSRFWFLRHYLEDRTTFNVTFSVQLKGSLYVKDLERAVQTVATKHEALRTCFFADENQQPMQGILEKSHLKLEHKSVSDKAEVSQIFEGVKRHDYDIEHGETMRVLLLSVSPTENFLIIGYHHINMDGVSLEVFLAHLEKAYTRRPLPGRVPQYSEFSTLQAQELSTGAMEKEAAFWHRELAEPTPPLPLLPFSSSKARQPLLRYDHNRFDARVDPKLAARIKDLCREQKVAVFHFYLAVYGILLFRFLKTEDLCVGMADAGRNFGDLTEGMGMYLNLLPLRFRLSSKQSFAEVLKAAKLKAYSGMANSRLPFDKMLDRLELERSSTHSPLFQAFINYRQGVNEKRKFGGCEGEGGEYSFGKTAYDFTLDILENPGDSTLLMFFVQKDLYSTEDSKVLVKAYIRLLDQFSESPESNIGMPSLFDAKEVDRAVELGRGPILVSKWPETLVHRVDEISKRHSSSVALTDGSRMELTYQQMIDQVNKIAKSLLSAKLARGSMVAVFQEPSAALICSILAIMRVGATYVPLDLRTPLPRLESIINDCQPAVVLVDDNTEDDAADICKHSAVVINIANHSARGNAIAVPNSARADDTAVVLYTSGTTGTPKGVRLLHSGLRNELEGFVEQYNIGAEVVLQQTALSFDFSLEQIFLALANGGRLVIVPKSKRGDPFAIAEIIREEEVTCTQATPSEYLSLLQHTGDELSRCQSWRLACAGGEQYSLELYQEFRRLSLPALRLLNVYGPSETTISSNRVELGLANCLPTQRVPAGYALPNCSVYIVDEKLRPVPAGIPGEICIGGAGVARGYLANDELTRRKFLPDSHASSHAVSNGWKTMYRTGDKGVLRNDGALVVLGRTDGDTQIKLRGIRIELEDIEETIMQAAGGSLSSVVVAARGDPVFLVAHAVISPQENAASDDRGLFLRKLVDRLPLPQYMRPTAIIPMESLPLSAHGKMDRRAIENLALEDQLPSKADDVFELTANESEMREVWKALLPVDAMQLFELGPNADFFQVGGNSLLLIKLQAAIRERFDVSVPLVDLFKGSTLATMAASASNRSDAGGNAIDWDAETSLPKELVNIKNGTERRINVQTPPRIVALTGSTGFVGRAILKKLLATSTVEKVHCLAVRNPQKLDSFAASPKMMIHRGDLNHSTLSLDAEAATALASSLDLIIHNGADVSFLKSYVSLRAPNVESTKYLVSLAASRSIPIHYISSVVVGRLIPDAESFAQVSVSASPPPHNYADAYGASKWASEVVLEKAGNAHGIPVCIHRLSSVTGEEVPEDDVMNNLLTFSARMRAVPISKRWKGVLDFVSVERVASGVLAEATKLGQGEDGMGGVRTAFRHQSSELVVPIEEMKAYVEQKVEASCVELPLQQWVAMAKDQGMSRLVALFLEEVEKGDDISTFQRLVI
ncbi:polyketide synthase [Saccharata proteae CBS 121410]|uniref:Polyketide synthase n=1 Tax=Saccharata proteae CBS 121410 TaxID=1314787 RepID=A0A9P4LSM8_9PEZI|nr:polyketide synthase [Saccharata proteae CBS 121410]